MAGVKQGKIGVSNDTEAPTVPLDDDVEVIINGRGPHASAGGPQWWWWWSGTWRSSIRPNRPRRPRDGYGPVGPQGLMELVALSFWTLHVKC